MSNTTKITPAQLKALQAEFARLSKDDDARTFGASGEPFTSDREGRLAWARSHLGVAKLDTFSNLTELQAEYLIDTLKKGHGKTKIDWFLQQQFSRLGILEPAVWFEAFQQESNKWKYGRRTLANLNRQQKCALAQTLSSRTPVAANGVGTAQRQRPRDRRQRAAAPAMSMSMEQRMLWGQ